MNDTKKEIKETEIDCTRVHKKLDEFHRVILGLNAYGSLELTDFNVIMDYLKGAFNYAPVDNNE